MLRFASPAFVARAVGTRVKSLARDAVRLHAPRRRATTSSPEADVVAKWRQATTSAPRLGDARTRPRSREAGLLRAAITGDVASCRLNYRTAVVGCARLMCSIFCAR